jgi:hypothetical protein
LRPCCIAQNPCETLKEADYEPNRPGKSIISNAFAIL